jgi:hypothetical protein
MRGFIVFALLVLASGCICTGGGLGALTPTTTEAALVCNAPYIESGGECCVDRNDNGVCDKEESSDTTETTLEEASDTTVEEAPETTETTEPPIEETVTTTNPPETTTTASQATTTLSQATTTTQDATCADGLMNQGEEYADCGGPCKDCIVLKLASGWQEYRHSGYSFRYDNREGVAASLKYNIEVRTPEGITDKRPISTGESFVDYLRLKVINYGEDPPKIYVRNNTEDLAGIAAQTTPEVAAKATLITVGGQSCATTGAQMCERNYGGYKIRMINRFEGGAKIIVYSLDGVPMTQQDVTGSRRAYSEDHMIAVGGFFDSKHIIQGGCSLLYAYPTV